MYKYEAFVEIPDEVVHKHTLAEWETHFAHLDMLAEKDPPLSYSKVAELLSKAALIDFQEAFGVTSSEPLGAYFVMSDDVNWINSKGIVVNMRMKPVWATEKNQLLATYDPERTQYIPLVTNLSDESATRRAYLEGL